MVESQPQESLGQKLAQREYRAQVYQHTRLPTVFLGRDMLLIEFCCRHL